MKMKNKAIICGLMAVASAITGCTDMLEKEPLDSTADNPLFWNNEANMENYANTFYDNFPGYNGKFYTNALTDDQITTGFSNWKYVNIPAESSEWSSAWTEIRRANAMINSINNYATGVDDATKQYWIGVARLNRAMQYWDLVRKFGDCTYLEKVLDVDDPELYGERQNRDEVMDKVLEDLNAAVASITPSSSKRTWSQEMANAMKAHICLWEGTFRKYRSETDGQDAKDLEGAERFLKEAVTACEAVMGSGNGYSLCDDYQSIYNSESLDNNTEIIFYKQYVKDVLTHSLIANTSSSSEQSGMSKDAFDNYLFLDGKPKATTSYDTDDAGVMAVSETDGKEHLDISAQLAVRDKRLSQTIDHIVCYAGRDWPRTSDGMGMTSASGYTVCKYDNTSIPLEYRKAGNYTCAPIYWLAVIYLNYAEAKAELADMGSGTIIQQDLDMTVNKLRQRAGLPDMSVTPDVDPANNMGVSNLLWEIRRERRCELMFDDDIRYWDLIRWHKLDLLDNGKYPDITIGANLKNEPSPDLSKIKLTSDGYLDGQNGIRHYEYKHYFYPIPSSQITLNPKLGQNPGWTE